MSRATHAEVNNTTGISNSFVGETAGYSNTTGSNNTIIGGGANVDAGNLNFATAIGAFATVSTSNTIVLGRSFGADKVRIPGLGAAGATALCRNASNEISTCSSSLRYKTNIAPFRFGLSLINQLRPISFDWKDGGMKDVGFGAEDVARINPLFVTYNAAGEVEGVKYDRLSAVFVNAFKEQQTQIERQQKQLDELPAIKAENAELKAQLAQLKHIVCATHPTAAMCRQP
ncbi:MAG: tail fiber domain-containing protein [Acidobacteriota bacterium]|nr:tail fiber domain-containing protein [Acidobacteriota bacterium]